MLASCPEERLLDAPSYSAAAVAEPEISWTTTHILIPWCSLLPQGPGRPVLLSSFHFRRGYEWIAYIYGNNKEGFWALRLGRTEGSDNWLQLRLGRSTAAIEVYRLQKMERSDTGRRADMLMRIGQFIDHKMTWNAAVQDRTCSGVFLYKRYIDIYLVRFELQHILPFIDS
jgi:hypothetical protein